MVSFLEITGSQIRSRITCKAHRSLDHSLAKIFVLLIDPPPLANQVGLVKHSSEHKRDDCTQLNENIEGRSTGVLQGISDGITNNCSCMLISTLSWFINTFK